MMVRVMVSGFKGGCGKTTIAHHTAVRAMERGLRVLVIDTDSQGDLYRRLLGDDANLADCPPAKWAPNCLVVHSPDAWQLPAGAPYDLVVVDTAAHAVPPDGPTPHLLVVPVDGVDAARNANETVAWARDRKVPATCLMLNGVEEGGVRFARRFEAIRQSLPDGVFVAEQRIPRGGSVKRTAITCAPAWKDIWVGRDANAVRTCADAIIDYATALADRERRAALLATPTRKPVSATKPQRAGAADAAAPRASSAGGAPAPKRALDRGRPRG